MGSSNWTSGLLPGGTQGGSVGSCILPRRIEVSDGQFGRDGASMERPDASGGTEPGGRRNRYVLLRRLQSGRALARGRGPREVWRGGHGLAGIPLVGRGILGCRIATRDRILQP